MQTRLSILTFAIAASLSASVLAESPDQLYLITKPSGMVRLTKVDNMAVKKERTSLHGLLHTIELEHVLKTDQNGETLLARSYVYSCQFPKTGTYHFGSREISGAPREYEMWISGDTGTAMCEKQDAAADAG